MMNEFARSLCSLVWAMEERALDRLISQVAAVTQEQIDSKIRAINERPELLDRLHARDGDGSKNTRRRAADVREKDLDIRDGVAHIEIAGPMMKQVPSILNMLGIKATSTEAARAELEAAVLSERVESIVLDIDSPGGTVDGTAALASDVFAVRGMKPITARVDDLMASAALYVGAQADRIEIGESAAVGSIGTFAVVDDEHRKFERAGIDTHVVSSHPLKGKFVPGTHVTDEQLDDLQRNINTYTGLFVDAVARGRDMPVEKVRELATGQMWIGTEALDIGLVDQVDQGADSALVRGRSEPAIAASEHRLQPAVVAAVLESTTTAAPAALLEDEEMDEKDKAELERLRAENADKNVKLEELEENKKELERLRLQEQARESARREELLVQYKDRIPPDRPDGYADFVRKQEKYEDAEEFLKGLPVVTRSERTSSAVVSESDLDEIVADHTSTETVAEHRLGKVMKQNLARTRDKAALADAVDHVEREKIHDEQGNLVKTVPILVFKDGRRMRRDEAKKALGLKTLLVSLVLMLFAGTAQASALSAARATQCRYSGHTKSYLMEASDTIYSGSMVMIDSDGEAVPAEAEASNNGVIGIAQETKTAHATIATWIKVSDGVICKFAGTTLGQDDVGELVYAEDDQTVDETAGSNEPVAGMLIQYNSASEGWVYIDSTIATARVAVTTDPITFTGDVTLAGGAGALTFSDSASSIVAPDDDSTALLIGSTDQLGLVTIDTTDGAEEFNIVGTTTVSAFRVDTGEATFDETVTMSADLGVVSQVIGVDLAMLRVFDDQDALLPNTAADDDIGYIVGTPGTNAPSLQTADEGGTGSEQHHYATFNWTVPSTYVAGSTVKVVVNGGMLRVADQAATTAVDLQAWTTDYANGDLTVSGDLCTTAAIVAINNATFSEHKFTIDDDAAGYVLAPGSMIVLKLRMTVDDNGDAGDYITMVIDRINIELST